MQRIEFRAMGSHMLAAIDADTPEAHAAVREVPAMFEEWEQHLSRFRGSSELNALNRANGRPLHVGTVLWDVLRLSLEAAEQSGDLVTPALLDVLEASGYDRSFDAMQADRQNAGRVALAQPAPARDWRTIVMDPKTRSV